MRYFSNIRSEAEAKERYRALALKLHPDRGGKTADFQAMKAEYEELCKQLAQQNRMGAAPKKPTEARRKPNPAKSAKAPKTPPTTKKTRRTQEGAPRVVVSEEVFPSPNNESSILFDDVQEFIRNANRAAQGFVNVLESLENFFGK